MSCIFVTYSLLPLSRRRSRHSRSSRCIARTTMTGIYRSASGAHPRDGWKGRRSDGKDKFDWMRLRDPATGKIPDLIRAKELAFAATLPSCTETAAFAKNLAGTSVQWQHGWGEAPKTLADGRARCARYRQRTHHACRRRERGDVAYNKRRDIMDASHDVDTKPGRDVYCAGYPHGKNEHVVLWNR